jgi:N-acetylated-alpha-linked acidic dipeptidase
MHATSYIWKRKGQGAKLKTAKPAPPAPEPRGYFVGPGPLAIQMGSFMQQRMADIWNVVATIRGETDETVIIGNHRDAWAYGAVDPSSGSAVLMEVARGLSSLRAQGWVPRRTLKLCR